MTDNSKSQEPQSPKVEKLPPPPQEGQKLPPPPKPAKLNTIEYTRGDYKGPNPRKGSREG
jgi:hypothetical protein